MKKRRKKKREKKKQETTIKKNRLNVYDDQKKQIEISKVKLEDELKTPITGASSSVSGKESGKQAFLVEQLAKIAWRIVVMTATPLVNDISDLYNTAKIFAQNNPMLEKEFKRAFPTAEAFNLYPY